MVGPMAADHAIVQAGPMYLPTRAQTMREERP
jgi:hypothetical protein